ncbi:hypothetical protein GJV06_01105 [Enterobacteriaceae bacterium RIT691]|nr:hypothetical protein [Enterobacteriaceae bacterium RIT691]
MAKFLIVVMVMNWLYYLGYWWRVAKFEGNNVFVLFSHTGSSSLMVSESTLRTILKFHWGFK